MAEPRFHKSLSSSICSGPSSLVFRFTFDMYLSLAAPGFLIGRAKKHLVSHSGRAGRGLRVFRCSGIQDPAKTRTSRPLSS